MAGGYLGLGSNVGDRRAHLEAAVAALPRHGVEVVRSSSVYETEPVGLVTDQREFLNACLRIETTLSPGELLDACKAVEREVGRSGTDVRHGPREIDVDLLLIDGVIHQSAGGGEGERRAALMIPHPTILERRFVLVPLLELDPELTIPGGRGDWRLIRLADALAALGEGQAVRRVGPPL